MSTIVVRGATTNIMDDIERAIDDGVNCFKALTRDARMVPGAGAVEMELAQRISTYGQVCRSKFFVYCILIYYSVNDIFNVAVI